MKRKKSKRSTSHKSAKHVKRTKCISQVLNTPTQHKPVAPSIQAYIADIPPPRHFRPNYLSCWVDIRTSTTWLSYNFGDRMVWVTCKTFDPEAMQWIDELRSITGHYRGPRKAT